MLKQISTGALFLASIVSFGQSNQLDLSLDKQEIHLEMPHSNLNTDSIYRLDLEKNAYSTIPTDLSKYTNLRELNLKDNKITFCKTMI